MRPLLCEMPPGRVDRFYRCGSLGQREIKHSICIMHERQLRIGESGAKIKLRFLADAGVTYAGTGIGIDDFNVLKVVFAPTGVEAGDDVIHYSNAPSDVGDTLGRTLAACEVEL